MLLAEDLGDSFVSFARRMGMPGIAAGLTSFALMWLTNRHVVNQSARAAAECARGLGRAAVAAGPWPSGAQRAAGCRRR